MAEQIVITYPPERDGELHIDATLITAQTHTGPCPSYTYTFTHASKGNAWDTLVVAAQGIIAQADRIKRSQRR